MSNTALSRTERAHRRCDVDDLIAIAAALGVSPAALLPLETSPIQTWERIEGVLLG
ncbi:hypothetical protein GCM10010503_64980 [Streptomyces lucensis JCM 4490]|uniref:HTH cro/C1-type domain-containing protein n=2 Tax=Streptomyces TaxID=1883 RepID=A0A918MWL4_9ACTN|nr:hypothetical protein GCM10010503_64980 [Streptomyces lucensis JCM 4490]